MGKLHFINGLEELKTWVGKEIAVSEWLPIDQARIQAFADVTQDHQWIHLDVERCRRESPYGLDRVRLPAPVIAGQRIRGHLVLEKLDDVKGGKQAHWAVTIEIEGADKPACVAQMLARYTPAAM